MVSILHHFNSYSSFGIKGQDVHRSKTQNVQRSLSISSPIFSEKEKHNTYSSLNSLMNSPKNSLLFYNIISNIELENKNTNTIQFIPQGTLVQLISHDSNRNECHVKLVKDVGTFTISFDYLEENSQLNYTLKTLENTNNDITKKPYSISNFTPPTSPSTIGSSVFSAASLQRGASSSSIDTNMTQYEKMRHIDPKIRRRNQIIESCEIISIKYEESKDKRIKYEIKYTDLHGKEKTIEKYYQDFYQLHLKLLSVCSQDGGADELNKFHNLPLPIDMKKSCWASKQMLIIRQLQMNEYLQTLSIFMTESCLEKEALLVFITIFNNWLLDNDLNEIEKDLEEIKEQINTIKLKTLFHGDYYVIKCKEDDILKLDNLKRLIIERIKHKLSEEKRFLLENSPADSFGNFCRLTAKIDGWYIVSLSEEETYQRVISNFKQTREKLIIEISV
ncbi:uncharacterized protein NDAI_0J00660 [Naumovozyma dairenensis CBS 421]|uniref:PX domain-containing protein n=1 Tax=Naumovozyma dairenensis (strain ATCC 10597 / BCRC 20456 / CBS 421 / NBRC 0211 / NRRL Y-12639) TaxID=1071378 RepID=G0WGN0_NAUDC|nr:hypothetical protein NDAI_0J00660 [Naumovozyma dairenensis CBS 421]CCD26958.1 hypothetical protein NDAI_0J00660 [Naumovozyma dairenensis CBS 421]